MKRGIMKNTDKKKKIIVSSLAVLLGGLGLVGEVQAWGPERETYTNENPAPQAVFNSITNNAAVGDERDFVRIVEISKDGNKAAYSNEVTVRAGYDYEVYIYYHNNASSTYNDMAHNLIGVARNVRVSAAFPQSLKAGERGQTDAIIMSDKTIVPEVWDEAWMTAAEDVTLSYISGSAKILNDWEANGSTLSTNLFSEEGTLIGYNVLNGVIPGCAEYSGQVIYQIRAEAVEQPTEPTATFEMDKTVSRDGANWAEDIVATAEETLEFRIRYKNTGTVKQTDVVAFDTLEDGQGMEYIKGTTRIVRGELETIVEDKEGEGLFDGGLKIGEAEPEEEIFIYYKVRVKELATFSCGKTTMYNLAGVSGRRGDVEGAGVATQYDKVRIELERNDESCLPAELPETGPAEIILASVVGLGLLVGLGYWLNSKREVKKLEKQAKNVDVKPSDVAPEDAKEDIEKTDKM